MNAMKRSNGRLLAEGALKSCRPPGRFLFVYLALLLLLAVSAAAQGQVDAERFSRLILHGSVEEKREALFQIRNLRSEAASRLALPALRDRDEMVRATAASSVVFLPGFDAAQAVLPLLNDKSEFVRREAAYALGEIGDASATAPLIALLQKEKVLEARSAAAAGLGRIGDPSAVAPLTAILKSRPREDDEFLRRSAARSIGQIAQNLKTGSTRVLTPQNFLPDKFKEIPPGSENFESKYPQFGPAVEILLTILASNAEADDTRREAAYALGAIGSESAVSALETGASSEDPYLAEISQEALLKIRKQ